MRVRFACLGVVAFFATSGANAQEEAISLFDRDRNIAVTEREHSGYSSEGLRRGAFLIKPGFAIGASQVSNVFASADDNETDIAITVRPSLAVDTTWSRHALNVAGDVTRRQFFEFDNESVWNWTLETGGRLDISRATSLSPQIGYQSLTEARTEAGFASETFKPIEYSNFRALIGGRHEMGRLLLSGEVGLQELDYDDQDAIGGGIIDQDFRDYTQYEVMARVDYAISPDTAVFARIRPNSRNYHLEPPQAAFDRDSGGYTVDFGADFDIGGVARGLLGVGYIKQNYSDPGLNDESGLSVDGQVEWFPTQLTTVTLQAGRSVEESPLGDSGGFFRTAAGARVDHELRRNIVLSGGFDVVEDAYRDLNRTDERLTVDIGANYILNRWIAVRLSWRHIDQQRGGDAIARDYQVNTFGFSLVRP